MTSMPTTPNPSPRIPATAPVGLGPRPADPAASVATCAVEARSRWATFSECPMCGGAMAAEHAHYRCGSCGWRDSCCD